MERHKSPGVIAASVDLATGSGAEIAFGCNLCGLCTVLCPKGLSPSAMFRELRVLAVEKGVADLSPYRGLLAYEDMGRWNLFTLFLPPQKACNAVFFPGCALPGSRPRQTLALFRLLRQILPGLGAAVSCCFKPSLDLGLVSRFDQRYGHLKDRLRECGAREVVTACPSCHRVFADLGDFGVKTAWEALAEAGTLEPERLSARVTIHDPCPLRHEQGVHQAVRRLAAAAGLSETPMQSRGEHTLCCGQGGAAHLASPETAGRFTRRRTEEAGKRLILTYCAGCADHLSSHAPTVHLLDALFPPTAGLRPRRASRVPLASYANRLRFKRWLANL